MVEPLQNMAAHQRSVLLKYNKKKNNHEIAFG